MATFVLERDTNRWVVSFQEALKLFIDPVMIDQFNVT